MEQVEIEPISEERKASMKETLERLKEKRRGKMPEERVIVEGIAEDLPVKQDTDDTIRKLHVLAQRKKEQPKEAPCNKGCNDPTFSLISVGLVACVTIFLGYKAYKWMYPVISNDLVE